MTVRDLPNITRISYQYAGNPSIHRSKRVTPAMDRAFGNIELVWDSCGYWRNVAPVGKLLCLMVYVEESL